LQNRAEKDYRMKYQNPVINRIQNMFAPAMTQSGQAGLACSSDPECAAAEEGGFDLCCEDGSNGRFSKKIVSDFGCNDFLPECDFQADVSTNFSCTSVSVTPLGECGGGCVFLVTCEGFSGTCPGEDHVEVVCTTPH
jgi:hypothetical protein